MMAANAIFMASGEIEDTELNRRRLALFFAIVRSRMSAGWDNLKP